MAGLSNKRVSVDFRLAIHQVVLVVPRLGVSTSWAKITPGQYRNLLAFNPFDLISYDDGSAGVIVFTTKIQTVNTESSYIANIKLNVLEVLLIPQHCYS